MKKLFFVICIASISILLTAQSWVSSSQTTTTDEVFEITSHIDDNGNIITLGHFSGDLTASGGLTITSNGLRDYYVIKFNNVGEVTWMRNFGSRQNDFSTGGLGIDSNGDIYITGGFQDYLIYSATDSIEGFGSYDVFLAKLNENGDIEWIRNSGKGASLQYPTTLEVDNSGNILAAGTFADSINFYDTQTLYNENTTQDSYYAKFDGTNGDLIWAKQINTTYLGPSGVWSIEASNNNYYLVGLFRDSLVIDNDTIVPPSYTNLFNVYLLKTDLQGSIEWKRVIAGNGRDYSYSLSLDDINENLYVSGFFDGDTLLFASSEDQYTMSTGNNGSYDLYIAKYDTSGMLAWNKTLGGAGDDRIFSSEYFENKLFVAGKFADTLNWGGIELITAGGLADTDMFSGAIEPDGNYRDANSFSGRNNSREESRAIFQNGNSLYTVMISNSDLLQIGDSIYTSDGLTDYIVLGVIGCLPISADNISNDTITDCYGDSTASILIEANGGFGSPWQYSLDNGDNYSTSASFGNLPAGSYQVVVIDQEGCSKVGPLVNITQPDTLLAMVDYKQDILVDTAWNGIVEISDGLLSIIASGGNGGYTYQLLPDGALLGIGYYEFAYEDSGKYVVAVNDSKNCGPSNSDTIEINVDYDSQVGVDDFGAAEVKIYPNPTSGIVTIEMPFEGKKTKLEVISMTGQIVLKRKVHPNGGIITETIDLSDQAKGLYMVRINGQSLPSAVVVK